MKVEAWRQAGALDGVALTRHHLGGVVQPLPYLKIRLVAPLSCQGSNYHV